MTTGWIISIRLLSSRWGAAADQSKNTEVRRGRSWPFKIVWRRPESLNAGKLHARLQKRRKRKCKNSGSTISQQNATVTELEHFTLKKKGNRAAQTAESTSCCRRKKPTQKPPFETSASQRAASGTWVAVSGGTASPQQPRLEGQLQGGQLEILAPSFATSMRLLAG